MSTARAIRRFSDEPVDDATLRRCFEAATQAPSGGNFQAWRFVILRSFEQRAVVAAAAAHALKVIEPVYELHDRAGEFTSVLFATRRFESASELLLGGSIYPAVQNFLLAARGIGLGACPTSWADYEGEAMLRGAVGVPDMWMLAAHVVVGWPRGRHGPLRRRPMTEVVALDHWDSPAWGDGPLWNPHGI
jgi:nitroreductase